MREILQVEIRSRDLRRSMAFYGSLFDWQFHESGPDYAIIDTGAAPIASIMETRDPKFPLGVANLVSVEDCEREGKRAVELGGQITVNKWEVEGSGWYVGTMDPWVTEIFFWQPVTPGKPHFKGSGKNPFVLLDIPTPEIPAGIAYYQALLGWDFSGVAYRERYAFTEGAGMRRGVGLMAGLAAVQARKAINYVAVDDLDALVAKLGEAGGKTVVGPGDLPGEGRYVIFDDPEGNRVGALQPA